MGPVSSMHGMSSRARRADNAAQQPDRDPWRAELDTDPTGENRTEDGSAPERVGDIPRQREPDESEKSTVTDDADEGADAPPPPRRKRRGRRINAGTSSCPRSLMK